MNDERAQAFEKGHTTRPRDGVASPGEINTTLQDPRPAMLQAWELGGTPVEPPIEPWSPLPGDAALAQSADWARALRSDAPTEDARPTTSDRSHHNAHAAPTFARFDVTLTERLDASSKQAHEGRDATIEAPRSNIPEQGAESASNATGPEATGDQSERHDSRGVIDIQEPTRSEVTAAEPPTGEQQATSDAAPADARWANRGTGVVAYPDQESRTGDGSSTGDGAALGIDPAATASSPDAAAAVEGVPAPVLEPAAEQSEGEAALAEPTRSEPSNAPSTETAVESAPSTASDVVGDGGHAAAALDSGGDAGGGVDASDAGATDIPVGEPVDDASEEAREDEQEDADLEGELDAIGAGVPEPSLGGGGGGGSAITPQPAPEAPDVAQHSPEAGLAQLAGARPDIIAGALGGVGQAVDKTITEKRAALATSPPTRKTRGDGDAPQTPPLPPETTVAAPTAADAPDVPTPAPPLTPEPTGAIPADRATPPPVRGGEGGALTDEDTRAMASSIDGIPARDPAATATAGPSPSVPSAGNADPAQAKRERKSLQTRVDTVRADARRAAAQPMGEQAITVTEPVQTLTAEVPTTGGQGTAEAPALPGAEQAEAIGIIAGQQEGDRISAALSRARADMAAERQTHAENEQKKRDETDAAITQLEQQSQAEQARERTAAQAEVGELRGKWQDEVDQQTDKARQEADGKVAEGLRTVELEKQKGETEASKAHAEGDAEAERARRAGEAEAEKLKRESKRESGGFLGWLASKAKAFFARIKKGISAALAKARKFVKAAIDKAKQLAAAAIERARKAIVGAIQLVGKALIAIGDRLLQGFPALRDKFRSAIEARVQRATDAANAVAKKLNDGIQKALDGLGKALDAGLGLLEKGLCFIVDGVGALVQGAIKAAEGFINGIVGFAALIKDVAAGPTQWLSNLGVAVVDGIKNHLWGAFKTSVKGWFDSKLTEVLGVGGMVIQTLIEGGFSKERITQTAWEGLKAAIPIALIGVLVEKLVSMIVPAAGTVMIIIEGLQAAWGTVSRIIAAFAAFMAFLKLVRSGNAGPAFARALAAGAVVVIDFVSNWLIKKIRKAAKAIGRKLKRIAKKLMNKLKRGKGGPKGKNKNEDKDKDKSKDKDANKAKTAARKAARKAWKKAKSKTRNQIIPRAQLDSIASAAGGRKQGHTVDVDIIEQGATWSIRATARKGARKATDEEGRGWIARDGQAKWYATKDQRPLHDQVIREADARLDTEAQAVAKKHSQLPEMHKALAPRIRKLEKALTRKLLKGIRFEIHEGRYQEGKDERGETALLYDFEIRPNSKKKLAASGFKKRGDHVFAHGLTKLSRKMLAVVDDPEGLAMMGEGGGFGQLRAFASSLSTPFNNAAFSLTVQKSAAAPDDGDMQSKQFGQAQVTFLAEFRKVVAAVEDAETADAAHKAAAVARVRSAGAALGGKFNAMLAHAHDPETSAHLKGKEKQLETRGKGIIEQAKGDFAAQFAAVVKAIEG